MVLFGDVFQILEYWQMCSCMGMIILHREVLKEPVIHRRWNGRSVLSPRCDYRKLSCLVMPDTMCYGRALSYGLHGFGSAVRAVPPGAHLGPYSTQCVLGLHSSSSQRMPRGVSMFVLPTDLLELMKSGCLTSWLEGRPLCSVEVISTLNHWISNTTYWFNGWMK